MRDYLPSRSTSICSTDLRATSPFREPAGPFLNSIQPSLKPSSIRIRGVGFFMPCDLNSPLPCLSRHSVHAYAAAKHFSKDIRDLIRGHAARPLQFDDSSAGP